MANVSGREPELCGFDSRPSDQPQWLDDLFGRCRYCGTPTEPDGEWREWVLVTCPTCRITGPTGKLE